MKKTPQNTFEHARLARRAWVKPVGAVLLAALLAPLAQAETWSFKIVGAPIAQNKNSPKFESIRVTGRGTFDPVLGVASASGAYTLFNAFDHPNGPVVNATWHSSSFVSWTADKHGRGTLTISFESSDPLANPNGAGQIVLTTEGVSGPIVAGEPYIIPLGGSGGSVRFSQEDDESFFPGAPPTGQYDFKLIGGLTAAIQDSTHAESMTVTGSGTFNTAQNTVTATGTFLITGASDEPGGPTFPGTWTATGFNTFLPSGGHEGLQGGTLAITVDFNFTGGGTLHGVKLTVVRPIVNGAPQPDNDAVVVQLGPDETFTPPANGSGGRVQFHLLNP